MKKHMITTSAIALGIAATPATAQFNLDWGGFHRSYVAFTDYDADVTPAPAEAGTEGIAFHTNSEIHFKPNITLNNGMSFGVQFALQDQSVGGDQNIDEAFVSVSSPSMGQLDIGSENSAGNKLMVTAPGVTTMYIISPSTSNFIPFQSGGVAAGHYGGFRQATLSSYTEVGGNDDPARITYYTPNFNGLEVGFSYAPTGDTKASSTSKAAKDAQINSIFDAGARYAAAFRGIDFTVAGRWGTGKSAEDAADLNGGGDIGTWGVGGQLGWRQFTFGGAYTTSDNDEQSAGITVDDAVHGDSTGWAFGVAMETAGPWTLEVLTHQSETEIAVRTAAGLAGAVSTDQEVERAAYRIGATRSLGPGIGWDLYVVHETWDATGATLGGAAGEEEVGLIAGTALHLNF